VRVLGDLLDAVFPARCAGCERMGSAVCDHCRGQLRVAPALAAPIGVDRLVAAFDYVGVARELVARVKYRNARGGIPVLGAAIVDALTRASIAAPDVVTWLPTTADRRRDRGFDHAALLARAVSADLQVPRAGLLHRCPGPAQTGRRAADRRNGPRFDCFMDLTGRRILLIDDVVTTGASLRGAATALREAGAAGIVAAVAARRP
jgi:ComF family protein